MPSLEEDPSLLLLRTLAPEACAADPQAAAQLAAATGGLPLTLELLGGYLAAPARSQFPDLSQQAFAELADPRRRLSLAKARLGGQGQQETLDTTIGLSLDDLAHTRPAAAAAFYALGAFAPKPARFHRAAAAAVTGADAATLALLIARNLVEADGDSLALHQTLADFAAVHLPPAARERHRDYYLALVQEDEEDWQRIETVYPQVLHAWRRQLAAAEADAAVVALADAMNTYQRLRGLCRDQVACLEAALACVQQQHNQGETARLLNNLGLVYDALGEKQKALAYYEQALPLFRQVGDKGGEATTLNNLGGVYDALGDKQKALAYYEQALPLNGRWVTGRWRRPRSTTSAWSMTPWARSRRRWPTTSKPCRFSGRWGTKGGRRPRSTTSAGSMTPWATSRRRWPTTSKPCRCTGRWGTRRGGDHAQQHRRGLCRPGREAEGAGLLRASPAAVPAGGGQRGGGDHAQQPRRGL